MLYRLRRSIYLFFLPNESGIMAMPKWTFLAYCVGYGFYQYGMSVPLVSNRARKYFLLDSEGMRAQTDAHTKSLIEEVLAKMNLGLDQEATMTFFVCDGTEPRRFGTLSHFGAYIGLPRSFRWRTTDDADYNEIGELRKRTSISDKWRSDIAKALVLDDDAKKYAIAREVALLSDVVEMKAGWMLRYVLDVLVAGLTGFAGYLAARKVYLASKKAGRQLAGPTLFWNYVFGGFVGFVSMYWLKSGFLLFIESRAETAAARLGPDYARGGVAYNSALLNRNVLYRNTQPLFRFLYTDKGREPYVPFVSINRCLPSTRLATCQQVVDEFKLKQASSLAQSQPVVS